ncbi:(2Fe-2S)-binding protein [Aurantivibrio plasticivorans]
MYICICNSVTDRAIHKAADNGASSLLELRKELGVASRCGQCACAAQEVLDQRNSDLPQDFDLSYAV